MAELFNQLTCFIVAEQGAERSQLRRQLESRLVTCYSLDRTTVSQASSVSVHSIIQRSDFVAGIVPSNASPNVAFELGLALGLKKPLLLFANDPSSVPFDLVSVNILSVSLLGSQKLDDYMDAFLRTISPSKNSSQQKPKATNSKKWNSIRAKYTELLARPDHPSGDEFAKLVERAFKEGGFSLSTSPSPDFGADFALASPKLIEAFGLPILIDIKDNSQNRLAQRSVDRLSLLIRHRRGGAGLMVTTQPHDASAYLQLAEPIVIAPIEELLKWLQTGTFEQEFLNIVDAFWTRER